MPTQAGSAFETVVVVVFERFEGALDIVRHHALVRAALAATNAASSLELGEP